LPFLPERAPALKAGDFAAEYEHLSGLQTTGAHCIGAANGRTFLRGEERQEMSFEHCPAQACKISLECVA
jgi:hypothetical protein